MSRCLFVEYSKAMTHRQPAQKEEAVFGIGSQCDLFDPPTIKLQSNAETMFPLLLDEYYHEQARSACRVLMAA
jgi:hypothetical protein